MARSESDLEALRRSGASPVAFGLLFERHHEDIYRYLERRVGRDVGEELAAQTFLIGFEKRATFDHSRGDVRPWLFGIATNLLRNHRRAEVLTLETRGDAAEQTGDPSIEDATERLHAGAERARLLRATASLEPELRDVIFLTALGELSPREIAKALGILPSTVRTRLWRARTLLRGRLGQSDTSIPEYLRPLRFSSADRSSIVPSPDGGI